MKLVVSDASKARIFVQIASYRDSECQHTLKDLFEKAKYPERVSVGLCWQYDPEEDSHCFEVPCPRPAQVREIKFHWKEGKGACWARSHTQALWEGEEYTLQVDAHSRFVEHWDEKLLIMLEQCPSEKALLSTYPAAYELPDTLIPYTSKIAAVEFVTDDVPPALGIKIEADQAPAEPIPGAFISAGFFFGPSAIIKDVPYDPNLYFWGEEVTLSARLWTHGWDIFHPQDVIVFHLYFNAEKNTSKRIHHWSDHTDWATLDSRSKARVRHLLGIALSKDVDVLKDLDAYGLGAARSLRDYYQYSGVAFDKKRVSEDAKQANYPARPDSFDYDKYDDLQVKSPLSVNIAQEKAPGITTARYGMMLYHSTDAYIGRSIERYGEWCEPVVRLLSQLCNLGDTIVEAGANIGSHTLALARLVGPRGRVYAYEPQRIVYQMLCGNIAMNGLVNVEAYPLLLGNESGLGHHVLPDYNTSGGNFGVAAFSPTPQPNADAVRKAKLDSLIISAPVTLLKANVNGMEAIVLEGAGEMLKRDKPYVYVTNERGKEETDRLCALLRPLGYTFYRHTFKLFDVRNAKRQSENVFGEVGGISLLAIPPERVFDMPMQGLQRLN